MDSADCGPTCLRMIAKHYGKAYSAEMLRKHSFISREGVSMLGISDAAEYIGFRTLGVKITFEQLVNEALLPCVLHWNQNHFVVCYDIKKTWSGKYKIYVSDPASQKLCYTKDEFTKCWISTRSGSKDVGLALLLEPTADFGEREEEVEIQKKGITSFIKYFYPYKGLLMQIVLAMVAGSFLSLIFPFLTQAMVDKGINGKNMGVITLILISQLVLFVAHLIISYIRSWILLYVNSRIDISLISDFLIKLTNMPLHFFDSKKTGDIMQRMGDHGRIKGFLMGNSIGIVFSLVNFVVFTIVLGYYDLKILCIFLIGNTMYVIWILFFMRYRRELDTKRFNLSASEQSNVIQLIQGMQDIKLNNCEKQKRWEWERIQMKLFKISVKGLKIGQIQKSGSVFFTKTTDIIISFMAANAVVNENMTLGMMMSLTYILGQISAPIHDFIGFAQSLQDAKLSLERLNEIHSQEDEEMNIMDKLSILPQKKNIVVKNLKFSYSGADRDYALNDVSVTIPEHKVTALVGESGCGKTTLIKLLQGFYTPNSGSITVDGVALSAINPHLWRRATGSVMQESFIFSDTIAKNIALCTDEVDVERLYKASKMANADEFISSLPMGYNTKIGMEGNGVSQGQRQRILIARAIYKNPELIFFDEATNALDATNESKIMNNLHEFYKGKTVVVAAHRLSTVKDADQIIVMKQAKVVETGTHAELIAKRGEYYTLVKNQLELNA
ncbi:MAG: peptidase domain-containing ABC transporter [Lachnospiraceae bacterium]|nr:peptidase domain-containing ABC transporter [Lachnospiraceae bacterium]